MLIGYTMLYFAWKYVIWCINATKGLKGYDYGITRTVEVEYHEYGTPTKRWSSWPNNTTLI